MAAEAFTGTASDTDSAAATLSFQNAKHFFLQPHQFKVSVLADGTCRVAEWSTDHYIALSGGPYSHDQMQQLWQDLAAIGFSPR